MKSPSESLVFLDATLLLSLQQKNLNIPCFKKIRNRLYPDAVIDVFENKTIEIKHTFQICYFQLWSSVKTNRAKNTLKRHSSHKKATRIENYFQAWIVGFRQFIEKHQFGLYLTYFFCQCQGNAPDLFFPTNKCCFAIHEIDISPGQC